MLPKSWLKRWASTWTGRPSAINAKGSRRRRVLLRLERLEVRETPAVSASLVMDLNVLPMGSSPNNFTDVNGTLFFSATTFDTGTELWKSDGTAAGTVLVKDIVPGQNSSNPGNLVNVNGTLFFSGPDGLYKSDGTAAGTVLLHVGATTSLTNVNGTLFYSGFDYINTNSGFEIWKSDGTVAGTVQVKDITPPGSGFSPQILTNFNGTLFFQINDGTHGSELWKSDGTDAGTVLVKDVMSGSGSSDPFSMTPCGGSLYFQADDGIHGAELWKTDGTDAGTTLVKDVVPGSGAPPYFVLCPLGNTLFFLANNQLWKSDGTAAGTVLVAPEKGVTATNVTNLVAGNGFVCFDGLSPSGLWRSDGTSAGTFNIGTGLGDDDLTNVNGLVYFSGSFSIGRTDGTTATLATNVRFPSNLTNVGGALYFSNNDATTGVELWKSDATSANTVLVKDIDPRTADSQSALSDVKSLFNVNGALYFTANDGVHGSEMCKTDGAAAGTQLVIDATSGQTGSALSGANFNGTMYFAAGSGSFYRLYKAGASGATTVGPHFQMIRNLAVGSSYLYFQATDANGVTGVWRTDGTDAGTIQLARIAATGGFDATISYMTTVNGTLFFAGSDGSSNGFDLWKSDGTPAGTNPVKDVSPGFFTYVNDFVNFNGKVVFTANDGVHGFEPWISDGTDAGTVLLKDINTFANSYPNDYVNANGTLFFVANNLLYKSDGTTGGTVQVNAANSPFFVRDLTVVGNSLYFVGSTDGTNYGLWKTDGSDAGTVFLTTVTWPSSGRITNWLTNLNGTLYFANGDSSAGYEIWKSDGTPSGTVLAGEVNPGITGGNPRQLTAVGNRLYFTAEGQRSATSCGSSTPVPLRRSSLVPPPSRERPSAFSTTRSAPTAWWATKPTTPGPSMPRRRRPPSRPTAHPPARTPSRSRLPSTKTSRASTPAT